MRTVDFIHIGYQKSATTWLQKNNFFHPDVQLFDVGKNSQLFNDFIYDSDFFFDEFKYRYQFEKIINSEKKRCCYGISWERLCGDLYNGSDSKRIVDRLYSVFGRVKIIITIRSQLTMIKSAYSQYIKMGGTCSFEKFLDDRDIAGQRFLERLKYDGFINYCRQLFGAKYIYVDCYESIGINPGDFTHRLFNFLNLDSAKTMNEENLFIKENKGFSSELLFLKKKINHCFYLPYNKTPIVSLPYSLHQWFRYQIMEKNGNGLLSKVIPSRANNRLLLSEQMQNELLTYYDKTNRWLSAYLDFDLSKYGYPMALENSVHRDQNVEAACR